MATSSGWVKWMLFGDRHIRVISLWHRWSASRVMWDERLSEIRISFSSNFFSRGTIWCLSRSVKIAVSNHLLALGLYLQPFGPFSIYEPDKPHMVEGALQNFQETIKTETFDAFLMVLQPFLTISFFPVSSTRFVSSKFQILEGGTSLISSLKFSMKALGGDSSMAALVLFTFSL